MKQNLIDSAEFEVKAGNGGNGCVSFLRNKQTRKGGPDGGDGGRGGSIWFEADENMTTLRFFAGKDKFRAEHGGKGTPRNRRGKNAEDMTIIVPVGTLINVKVQMSNFKSNTNDQMSKFEKMADLDQHGQRVLIAKGGEGGRGNKAFASSSNTTPREAEMGVKGERKKIQLELKILADIGLVGLPNVGKSTLLSVLTKAKPEIADYPFTTLSPNLGVMILPSFRHSGTADKSSTVVIADIPGLIEEAHKGRGLGVEFLKHIERCRLLVHVLAPNIGSQMTDDRLQLAEGLYQNYQAVRRELGEFNEDLLQKPEIVVVNKFELIQDSRFKIQDFFKIKGISVMMISAVTHEGLEELRQEIQRRLIRAGVVDPIGPRVRRF